jgi:hypothetical protein
MSSVIGILIVTEQILHEAIPNGQIGYGRGRDDRDIQRRPR